jgi:hypothetical protein
VAELTSLPAFISVQSGEDQNRRNGGREQTLAGVKEFALLFFNVGQRNILKILQILESL